VESQRVVTAFGQWEGFGSQPETEDEVQVGVARARQLVASGQAPDYLRGIPFIADQDASHLASVATRQHILLDKASPLVVSPNRVVGANSFTDWRGRGVGGSGSVNIRERERSGQRSSIDQISDYATRDTALPPLDDANIFLTDNGAFVYAGNSHRTAAAKLRNESLKISSFTLYDMRGKTAMLDEVRQHILANMQVTAQTTSS
jgi:hypothetical protein